MVQGLSLWSLHVFLVYVWVLCGLPPTVQKHAKRGIRLIGFSKLPIGLNGFLSLYVSPDELATCPGCARLHLMVMKVV